MGPSLGGRGQNFLITVGGFYNDREYSGADWPVLLLGLKMQNLSKTAYKIQKKYSFVLASVNVPGDSVERLFQVERPRHLQIQLSFALFSVMLRHKWNAILNT